MLCPWPNFLFLCVIGSDQDESNALSSGAVISIVVVATFVVAFTLGNITGALILYCAYSHEVLVRRSAARRGAARRSGSSRKAGNESGRRQCQDRGYG